MQGYERVHRGAVRHFVRLIAAALAIVTASSALATPAAPLGTAGTRRARAVDSLAIGAAIREQLAGARPLELSAGEWGQVARLYGGVDPARSPAPLWIEHERLAPRARALAATLGDVRSHGLLPGDYPLVALAAALDAARPGTDAAALARADVLLTASFVDLADDLLTGRVDPQKVEPAWHITPGAFDVAARIRVALDSVRAGQSVSDALAALRPDLGGYRELVRGFARYRAIAERGGWATVAGGPTIRPGDADQRVLALRARLAAEGYVASSAGSDTLDEALARAVAEFQARHGLTVDSMVGPRTRAALGVSAEYRARQIAANLERLRWLPPAPDGRFVVVNVPAFHLVAFDSGRRVLTMRVVVGDELVSRRTPIFADTMQYVEFGPYWNVPRSIAVNEILPRARRDRSYLARNRFQILRGWGDDAPVVDPRTLSDAALFSSRYRVRQLPGPNNALGRVKFMFPNDYAVYLHDTPARSLFEEADRAHSHGCVRVADPEALAEFVLAERDDWPPARIASTLQAGRRVQVNLRRGVPVYLVYLTAFARNGEVDFRDDIYDRDARLLDALATEPGRDVAARDAARRLARFAAQGD